MFSKIYIHGFVSVQVLDIRYRKLVLFDLCINGIFSRNIYIFYVKVVVYA